MPTEAREITVYVHDRVAGAGWTLRAQCDVGLAEWIWARLNEAEVASDGMIDVQIRLVPDAD